MRFTIKFLTDGRFAGKYALMDDDLVSDVFDTPVQAVESLERTLVNQRGCVAIRRRTKVDAIRAYEDSVEEMEDISTCLSVLREQLQLEAQDR